VIWRRNLLPTITVQADVVPGIEAKTVNTQLAPAIAQLSEKLPEGYTIEAGGTIEESAKGLNSIVAVFPLMIMLMLIILMVQLGGPQTTCRSVRSISTTTRCSSRP
jgi:multidrug efflux pump